MRWRAVKVVTMLTGLSCMGGCQTARTVLLSLIGVEKKPLSIALVMDPRPDVALAVINPFPRYAALQEALGKELGRPIAVDPCFAFQAQRELETGWYQVAVVTPIQYARLSQAAVGQALAVPVDGRGRAARAAVLLVAADSPIQTAGDLRGKSVAFGPEDDSRTHHAALQLLREAGVEKSDLALEVLPIPGTLKHMPTARSVMQAVMHGTAAAGFVDEAAWDELPETGAKDEPARDKLRVIGRTAGLPDHLFVASPHLDEATADAVRSFLTRVGAEHPKAVAPLGVAGYALPDDELLRACRSLVGEGVAATQAVGADNPTGP